MPGTMNPPGTPRRGLRFETVRALGLAAVLAAGTRATAEEPAPRSAPAQGVFRVVGAELSRWGSDSFALVTAPASWEGSDWARLGVASAGVGGLMLADGSIYDYVEGHRTKAGEDFAKAVAPFGAQYAVALSAGLLAGGLVFDAPGTRDTGRDAVEASVVSGLLVNVVLKPAFGRERPYESDGKTVFHPFSSHASFPSGHATEAFTVASVVAMHSDGWVVPTIAWTVASLVGVSRVVTSHHFASDVAAGAVFGTTVGRFVVRRHRPVPEGRPQAVRVTLVAIPHGLGVHASW